MKSSLKQYRRYLKERGLKSTKQRDLIVVQFFKKHSHITVDELCEMVRKQDPSIGAATVYRTLNLLTESGLAYRRDFGGGKARFEQVTGKHHDHLICLSCNQIVEFENDQIEDLQEEICKKNRFELINHKMELYGYCQRCQKGRAS